MAMSTKINYFDRALKLESIRKMAQAELEANCSDAIEAIARLRQQLAHQDQRDIDKGRKTPTRPLCELERELHVCLIELEQAARENHARYYAERVARGEGEWHRASERRTIAQLMDGGETATSALELLRSAVKDTRRYHELIEVTLLKAEAAGITEETLADLNSLMFLTHRCELPHRLQLAAERIKLQLGGQ